MDALKVDISGDKQKAFLTVRPGDGDDFTPSTLLKYLKDSGICSGIDEAAVRGIVEQKRWGEKLQVASGKTPSRGKDGAVEYLFDTHPKFVPRINEDGSTDYRNLNLTQNVTCGQELAKLMPPMEGEEGINVLGVAIPGMKGKPARLLKGKHTIYANSEKTILKSEIDGNVKLGRSGMVEVDAAFKVNNNVDFTTGNIDVKGDLVIHGDIKAGFKVKAGGEIEVGGTIEDAEIETEGSVMVKGGFIGDGKGIIKSGKDVILKFIHGQKVMAGGNIHVHEESIQAELNAGESIQAHVGKGIIIGGIARAGKNATIKVIGNVQYTKTEIIVAEKSGVRERIGQITKELAGLNIKMNQITDKMTWFMTKNSRLKLNQVEENEFRTLDKISADISVTEEALRVELRDLEEKLRELRSVAFVKVIKHIYPGTTLRIAGLIKEIDQEFGAGSFRVIEGQINYLP